MEKRGIFLGLLAVLVGCSICTASITNVTYADDGDGAFVCTPWSWTGNASELAVSVYGDQYGVPGHLKLNILTTDPEDPTLKISNSIDNETAFAWTAFTVNLYMDVTFAISNVTVTTPGDWSVVSVTQPIYTGSNYVGTVIYDNGTPLAINGTIDFGYWVLFSGSPAYVITQEMIPVPEPSTLGFVLISGLLLGGFARARCRRGTSRRDV